MHSFLSRDFYEQVYKLVNDSIIVVERATGKVIAANPKAYNLYEYEEPELLNLDFARLNMQPPAKNKLLMDKIAANRNGYTYQTRHKKKNGTVLDVEVNSRLFRAEDKEYFLNVIRDISARKQFARDLELAKAVQVNLMPEDISPDPNFSFSFFYQPLRHVSGDMYDVVQLNDNCLVFLVVDVMGHGIAAALYTAAVKLFFRDKIRKCSYPSEFLSKLNRYFNHNADDLEIFMGAICLFLNGKTGTVLCSNGGMNEFMLFDSRQKKCRLVENKGPFIGMFADSYYSDYGLNLNRGDQLYLYTDGLVELRNVNDSLNPQELLGELIVKDSRAGAEELFSQYLHRLTAFNDKQKLIQDDLTLLKIEYN